MERIETRINKVYYLDNFENIQETIIYRAGKIKMIEALHILQDNNYNVSSILKVLLEDVIIEIPTEEIENYNLINL